MKKEFFERDADVVARDLLGKKLIRIIKGKKVGGIIVETEAYFGENDPASRAYIGKRNMNSVMWDPPGTIFVYMVHANWMLNFVTGNKGDPQAVLIRAIQPTIGIDLMKRFRGIEEVKKLANGPGKLTRALKIDKSFNRKNILRCRKLKIEEGIREFEIGTSHRIGVKKDLKEKLRFFIKNNEFVSHKQKTI